MDKAGTLGFAGDLPLEEGNALPFVGAAVAGATIYGPDGLPFVDVPDHPNFCCAPSDRRITRWCGASKSRLHPPRPYMLPIAYPTFGAPFALHDCEHKTTNVTSDVPFLVCETGSTQNTAPQVWIFEGDANQIHLSDFVDSLKWIRAMVVIRYMVGFFEAGVAAARPYVLAGHGDAALHARFERLNIDFDPAAEQPVYSPRMASFMNTVKRRRLVGPALGRALVVVCQGLFRGGLACVYEQARYYNQPLNNYDLFMNIVSYLPLSAHNFPFDWNADSRINPLVQWNGVADVAKIAKLKTPDGSDVFPSSVAVARDIAAFFVARAAAHA